MFEIKRILHESKTNTFMELKSILSKLGVKEISLNTSSEQLNFYSKKLFTGSLTNLDHDKIEVLIKIPDESFARDFGHEIQVAIDRKFIQEIDKTHQSFFNQQQQVLFPRTLDWNYSGVTISKKEKIYTVKISDGNQFSSKTDTFGNLQIFLLENSMDRRICKINLN